MSTRDAFQLARQIKTHLIPTPREHWQRDRYRNVYTYLSDVYFVLKLPRRCAGLGEDRRPISVWILIDDGNRLVQCVGLKAEKYRTKYFASVAICPE